MPSIPCATMYSMGVRRENGAPWPAAPHGR
jgi:hypothetical protein